MTLGFMLGGVLATLLAFGFYAGTSLWVLIPIFLVVNAIIAWFESKPGRGDGLLENTDGD